MELGAGARGDDDRAGRRRRRQLLPARARAVRVGVGVGVRRRGGGIDQRGGVRGVRLRRFVRGHAARAADARGLVGAERRGDDAGRRAHRRCAAAGRPGARTGGAGRRSAGSRRSAAGRGRGGLSVAKGRKRKAAAGDVATNRQASFRYNLLDRFEAGIVLTGTEVKSLREANAQLKDAYAVVRDGEVWLIGMYIAPYGPASRENHDPERERKLLLHRGEIDRLTGATRERGLTLVPTRVYFSAPGSRAKVELALARGKDIHDKRETIRRRETQREIARELRDAQR